MATTTTNMDLTKPTKSTDLADIDVLNANSDKIDTHNHSAGKGVAIADGSISNNKLIANCIATGNLADGVVTNAKLADGAISNNKLIANVIATGNLADGAVTNGKIADGSISNNKLVANCIATGNIADGAVTATKFGLAWVDWTPGIYQGGGVGTTVIAGRYMLIGKMCTAQVHVVATNAGTAGNVIAITGFPAPAYYADGVGQIVGAGGFWDNGTSYYALVVEFATSFTVNFRSGVNTVLFGQTPATTVASGDEISFTITYRVV